ncbi:uncharacterized protein LOC110006906 isoform X2 [Amborella trichopoda]|uniref:uncharacterized protein LOC110006906 isoform X2 n=1 Tax=Amborella trichopoda TaxID=13333 RepID=UPI0009BE8D94|nr:uncharacterized protein LOC110006906 isoform X2 [Amborella trichopoda]|eukprot:XP_020520573.1 uncharacterized protein LOC110006906 isoform X2 [Amborella trichopoda]
MNAVDADADDILDHSKVHGFREVTGLMASISAPKNIVAGEALAILMNWPKFYTVKRPLKISWGSMLLVTREDLNSFADDGYKWTKSSKRREEWFGTISQTMVKNEKVLVYTNQQKDNPNHIRTIFMLSRDSAYALVCYNRKDKPFLNIPPQRRPAVHKTKKDENE